MAQDELTALQRVSDGRHRRIRIDFRDWPVQLLGMLLVGAFAGQVWLGAETVEQGAVSAAALREGRWWTLFTSQFLHGGLVHLLFNLSAAMALGGVVIERFGRGLRGAAMFFVFFVVCGALAGLGFAAVNAAPAIGASGAICGLWGAGARLAGREEGLSPLFGRVVRGETWSLVVSNLVLVGSLAVAGALAGQGVVYIAWEAHAAGFVAGLLLAGPFLRLAGRR